MELKVLATEILSADNIREICVDANGKRFERLKQKIDKKTGMLASRSRSLQPEVIEHEVVRPLAEVVVKVDSANPSSSMSEAERKEVIAEKLAKIEEKKVRASEAIRISQLDEDDEKEEVQKSEEQRELEKEIIERNQQAAKNVDEIRSLQADLKSQGKNAKEIKDAIKDLKLNQKKRGRPAAEALKNPVKDLKTGEFKEDESGE